MGARVFQWSLLLPPPIALPAQFNLVSNSLGIGRTFRYADRIPPDLIRWSFGFGLSFTSWAYSDLTLQPLPGGGLAITAVVKNTGSVASHEVAQVRRRRRTGRCVSAQIHCPVPPPLSAALGLRSRAGPPRCHHTSLGSAGLLPCVGGRWAGHVAVMDALGDAALDSAH